MKSQAITGLNKATRNDTSVDKSRRKKVFIGLSGGVDSSVSAALLKKQGYDITGVFIRVWQPDWLPCTWREERRDAMRVAAHLNIPFLTLDLEEEYKRDVADYMISEYRSGRTPNPDVMCNKTIKFGAFYDWAMKNGADYVATGHYSQIKNSSRNTSHFTLSTSCDSNKDQSYFLWNIRTEQLPHILFPVGHLTKSKVRRLAQKFKLPTAEKKDSQGICFIGMVDMKTFLSHYINNIPGDVLDIAGNVIGRHPGALLFTIGERHGFTITKKSNEDRPVYVISKDVSKNTITVASQNSKTILKNNTSNIYKIRISQTNWCSNFPILGNRYLARTRYRQELTNIIFENIDTENRTADIKFENMIDVCAPGQSLVIYDKDICLGGGIIL